MENNLIIWEDNKQLGEIKKIYGGELNDSEWQLFLQIGKATGLNPFLREVWAIRYQGKASIFIGRDGYRKGAQKQPEYEYHFSDAVYSNDQFSVNEGKINHQYSLKDRGDLVGAYALVKRKSSVIPVFVYVELKEYKQAYGVWVQKPATMIKKVAEAQALRMAFQEVFAGTYDESEEGSIKGTVEPSNVVEIPRVEDILVRIQNADNAEEMNAIKADLPKIAKSYSMEERQQIGDTFKARALEMNEARKKAVDPSTVKVSYQESKDAFDAKTGEIIEPVQSSIPEGLKEESREIYYVRDTYYKPIQNVKTEEELEEFVVKAGKDTRISHQDAQEITKMCMDMKAKFKPTPKRTTKKA